MLPCVAAFLWSASPTNAAGYFGIQVVDEDTGRGVPLVELSTVDHLKFVTDSGGWVAFFEPGLMGQRVFFSVKSHGYEMGKDGFGYSGKALETAPGGRARLVVKRLNLAERLYRVTGEGIYRDSVLLGESTPLAEPLGSGKVAGQDSVFGEIYQNKIYWFWGDTSRMSYPLGHFWMACATSELPGTAGGLDPALGVNLSYLTDQTGFSRPVARLGVEKGLIWADGFLVLRDEAGRERLVCHYAHMESLYKMLGHGLAVFDDQKQEFVRLKSCDMKDLWCWPGQAHPIRLHEQGTDYICAGQVFPSVRVEARWEQYVDPGSYESFTCLESSNTTPGTKVSRAVDGGIRYGWRRNIEPMDGAKEKKLVESGQLKQAEAHFLPLDVDSGKPVVLHRGSVRWNEHRKRWIMVAGQIGGASNLGEIWYSEATAPTGPWRSAKRIVTHDHYSFYNPVHHPFFDQEGGRWIYFEGTYTHTFSGNNSPTPRYDYNQIMYRLDLDHPGLKAIRAE